MSLEEVVMGQKPTKNDAKAKRKYNKYKIGGRKGKRERYKDLNSSTDLSKDANRTN